ncbi:transposon ty3-I gag-pol polyprotein [Tanacetum coccineum]
MVDDASKINMATRYLKDTAALWWRRWYGDIEQGTATINTWAEFVADFKKQFYQENAKNEVKSRLHKLKQSETIREYVKEFTPLVLEISKLSDQDFLFYFLDGLQGWAKTDTMRDSSNPKDQRVNHEKVGGENNAQPKVNHARKPPTEKDKNLKKSYKSGGCFICDGPHRTRDCPKKASLNRMSDHEDEGTSDGRSMGSTRILNAIKAKSEVLKVVAKRLGINATKGSGTIKAVNSEAKPIHGVAKDVRAKIGEWEVTSDLLVVPMDDFKVVLGLEFLDKLPPEREVDHTIKLEMGSKPPAKAPYQMPPPELEELRKQLMKLMDAGYIRPSKDPYGALVLFKRKKDGSLQMCIDYQAIKKITIKNKYPIPLIADFFDQLGKEKYLTKLDLGSGYYQVRISEGDEAKMACVTRYGSYEFLVMPFGLTNAPVTFCTLMNKLFHPFLDKFMVVYLDDIVVYSHTLEEHVLQLKQVFQVLRDNEIYVKLEKCSFTQDEVEFLGHNQGWWIDDGRCKDKGYPRLGTTNQGYGVENFP